jgi:hypothetical protein
MSGISPLIAVVNESSVLSDQEVANAIPAFQYATAYRFRRYWDAGASIHQFAKGIAVPRGAWVFAITDTSDQPGALAYHDVDGNAVPTASIFAKTEAQYGASWTVSLTHELWEALADPECTACAQISQTELVALETADPVEDDKLGFKVKGADGSDVLISAFVTRNWFVPGAPGPYSYPDGILSKPLSLAQGGYVSIAKATSTGLNWTENQMRDGELVPAENPYEKPGQDERYAIHGGDTVEDDGRTTEERMRRVRRRGEGRLQPHHLQVKAALPDHAEFTAA